MHAPWQIDCLYFAAFFNLALIVLVRARIRVAAANPFILGLLLAALWAAIYGLDLGTADPAAKVWLLRTRFLFLPFGGMVWFEMAHRFALGRKALYGRRLALAAAVPVLTVLLVWLPLPPGFAPMIRPDFRIETLGRFSLLHFGLGPWAAVIFAHILGFLVAAFVVLWRTRRDTPWERGAHLIIIGAGLVAISANVLFVLRVLPPPGLNYGPLLSPVTTGLVALAMLRGRFFTLAPVARATLIENLEERLVVLDAAGRVVDLNRAAAVALGVAPEAATGRAAESVLAPWPEVAARLGTGAAGKADVRIGEAAFELTIHLVADRRNRPLARILSLRDVTQRRRDEEDLRRAKEAAEAAGEAKSRFLATVSHEIRTPLNQVLGFAQLMEGTSLTGEQRECLDHIVQGGRSLLGIVEGMLEYIQLSAGESVLKAAPCAPRELTARACEPLARMAQAKGLTLRWSVDARVPEVIQADPARLAQIITHLGNNAVKFTDQGGVDVAVACADPAGPANGTRLLEIAVRDTGIGIPPELLDRIFEPFVQADDSTTRRHGGVGLGLPIARRLCEMMGGGITVRSEPGRGTVFTARIAFPRTVQDG